MCKQIPSGYKQTKVGIIPEDWHIEKIKKIFTKTSIPVTVNMDEHYQEIGIRSHGKGIFYKERTKGKDLGNKSVFWVQADCLVLNIVFAWEQAIAKTTDKEAGMIASHRFPMYKPDPKNASVNYFLYFFKSKRGKLNLELASPGGAGRNKTLGQYEFAQLDVALPPLKEQEKIAEILSTWENAIARQEQLIEQQQIFIKAMIHQIFSQKIRFNDNNGNDYPAWEKKTLGKIGSIIGGGTPDTKKQEYWNGEINWFTPTELKSKYISVSNKTISSLGLKKSSAKLLPKQTILLTTRATIGDISICTQECTTNQGFQNIIVNQDKYNNEFIYYLISNNKLKLIEKASGSTFPEISKTELLKIPFLMPSLEEQTKIANYLTNVDNEIINQTELLEQLKLQKKSLMQKLLTGDVMVKV
ncbi:MAG TPA: restriction endonuclease subunit S [Aquella sp.]|nr:restriction endonuclease subunit S [Aquella sp.]